MVYEVPSGILTCSVLDHGGTSWVLLDEIGWIVHASFNHEPYVVVAIMFSNLLPSDIALHELKK